MTRFMAEAEFSPPLHRNDQVVYEISEKHAGTYMMTKEEVLEQVQRGNWLLKEPYEWTKYLIIHPTDTLLMNVTFPEEYSVEGEQPFDVTLGQSTYRNATEINRLSKESAFSSDRAQGKLGKIESLNLSVKRPTMGMCYWLRWIPPAADSYKRLLSKNNRSL